MKLLRENFIFYVVIVISEIKCCTLLTSQVLIIKSCTKVGMDSQKKICPQVCRTTRNSCPMKHRELTSFMLSNNFLTDFLSFIGMYKSVMMVLSNFIETSDLK